MLMERDAPLDALQGVLAQAGAGRGSIVVLGGEAGIGKTSLLQEFAQRVGKDCRVFWGGCEALFTPRALGPLQDIAPALDPRVARLLEQPAAPDRLFPAVLATLQEVRRPTVLIFEDVHWADNATLDLVKYLGRRIALLRVVLVLSLRTDEVGPDHPLARVLGDLPAAATVRITLQPFSPDAVATLAEQAGRPLEDLYRITAGNPFFVTELLASRDVAAQMPASVRDAVWSRLSRLPKAARDVLEAISIIPGSVEPWLVEALAGAGADSAVDQCVARGVLVRDEQGMLRFRHELARQAALDRLPLSVQQGLHARAEGAIAAGSAAQESDSLTRRVHHAASAGDGARVLGLAPQAARHAARLGAHQQAAAHLAAALRYVAQAPKRVAAQLYEEWAYEAGLALRIDEEVIEARWRAVALWKELDQSDKVGLNLRWLSRLHWYRGEAQQAQQYADEAVQVLEGLPPGPELAVAYSVRAQLHMLHDRFDAAIEWGERAIALAQQVGDIETRVHALNTVGTALLVSDRAGGREKMEESLALALRHGLHEQAARAYTNYGEYAVLFKDFALAERLLAEGIAFDTRHDLDAWTHYLVGRQALLRMEQGRLHEAETIARGVMGLERLTVVMRLPALTVLGRVHVRMGEGDGVTLLQRALGEALATGEPQNIVPVRLALTEAAWLTEDIAACREQLAALAAMDVASFDRWERGEFACWRQRSGLALGMTTLDVAGPRAAELGGDALAAAGEWSRLGLPYEAALALMQVRGAGAADAVSRAISILEEIGARGAASAARRLARRLGLDGKLPKARRGPYSAARHHPLGLTRRELQVLELVAQGLGNREIAQRLVRSPRTIEHHFSAVLGKLNASSRMDVVLRLRSEPWLLSPSKIGGTRPQK